MAKPTLCITLAAALLGLAAAAPAATLTVGSKNFTEQFLIAEMTSRLLEKHGFTVDERTGLGSVILRQAMENGQVDVYWEYTGTSLITYNKIDAPLSPEETYQKVKELDAAKGIVWLEPSRVNNTHAFAMNPDQAEKHHLKTLSDLGAAMQAGAEFTLACGPEFIERPDGLKPMQKVYGFDFDRSAIKRMDPGLVYQALRNRQVDIGLVYTTDGRIPAFGFMLLEDDKGYFPAYAMTPVVRQETLD
ncbi:MAG: glycine betaine ABC transporter substrate-binding protein, partial [Pseudomonadota bacterium]|nr:glycine betaine ABC transporter substrate-binding protein [Pseudomonadota bacterium]